jgi:uncharacterized protein YdeI (YjbR/CyaY-like superfamily)
MHIKLMKTFTARNCLQWRRWLQKHHDCESEVWLIFHKRHTGGVSIAYSDALDEALCFGWVDSLIKRIDDDRFARKFTPRRPDSKWSAINRKRYSELKAAGRLKPPGVLRAPTERTYAARPSLPSRMPRSIQTALKQHSTAWKHFQSLAPSHQRRFWGWISLAKQETTRMRRLQEAIRLLTAGQTLGLK